MCVCVCVYVRACVSVCVVVGVGGGGGERELPILEGCKLESKLLISNPFLQISLMTLLILLFQVLQETKIYELML